MRSSFVGSSLLALVCLAGLCHAAESADVKPNGAAQYFSLDQEYKQAVGAYNDALRTAKTDEERQAIFQTLGTKTIPNNYVPKFMAIIREHPHDPAALDAFIWIHARLPDSAAAEEAVNLLTQNCIEDENLAKVCQELQFTCLRPGEILLRAAIDKNPHRSVQGYARFSLASALLKNASKFKNYTPSQREAMQKEAEQLLQTVVDKYADLEHYPSTLGKAAAECLYESQHLAIGKIAPEIEGTDLDGNSMKLSDFRGNVVLLVFWGTTCGPCMASIQHERELYQKMAGKPFVIVGVNDDEDPALAKRLGGEKGMIWRSFHDGKQGPIATQWNVTAWPCLYLIDTDGTIRNKGDVLCTTGIRVGKDGKPVSFQYLDEEVDAVVNKALATK